MVRRSSSTVAGTPKVDFERLVSAQGGLLTRRQALAAGLDDEFIRRQLRDQRWQRLLPGMYATFTGGVTLEQHRRAATMYAGAHSQVTGVAALVWHGFRQLPADRTVHLLVPHSTRRASRGFVRIQRTHRLDQHAVAGSGYMMCSVARAVSDACRLLEDLRPARAIVAEAVQRGLTTVVALRRELDLAATSRTRLLRTALGEIDCGTRSAPEVECKAILDRSKIISRVLWNQALIGDDGARLPTPDGWLDDAGIAIEVDSREYHLGPDGWQSTMRRHNALAAYGAVVLHFTPSEIRSRPAHVRETVERAYQARIAQAAQTRVQLSSPVAEEGAPPTV
jgi:hypothetical protein